jgi:methylenetetrahydrofolate dehydrogenase (NADP+)/methenyltetrahydrofolate cyclohydrolase
MQNIKEYAIDIAPIIMEGKSISQKIKDQVTATINQIKEQDGVEVMLAVILIGDDAGSQVYVRNKEKACEKVGIKSVTYRLDANTTQAEAEQLIKKLAVDDTIHGILLQLPVPKHLDSNKLVNLIPAYKDVDGLTDENMMRLFTNKKGIKPCTPSGVVDLLKSYDIPIAGKNIIIIGRSNLVGKPLSIMLTSENATVTLCHSKTQNISAITKTADILVCALGKPKFLTADMVKEGCVVIDVGINRLDSGLCGDADFENILPKAYAITPVPGSCGPMTIAELLSNTISCYIWQKELIHDSKSLKANEVMTKLSISRQTLSNYVKRGLIKVDSNYTGRGYRYNAASVEALRIKNI